MFSVRKLEMGDRQHKNVKIRGIKPSILKVSSVIFCLLSIPKNALMIQSITSYIIRRPLWIPYGHGAVNVLGNHELP